MWSSSCSIPDVHAINRVSSRGGGGGTESVSLGEISLIVGMIKGYVIVAIVYLNAFYIEKGQMIGYYTVTTVIVKTLFRLYKLSPWLHCLPQSQHCIKVHFMEWRSFDGYDH